MSGDGRSPVIARSVESYIARKPRACRENLCNGSARFVSEFSMESNLTANVSDAKPNHLPAGARNLVVSKRASTCAR